MSWPVVMAKESCGCGASIAIPDYRYAQLEKFRQAHAECRAAASEASNKLGGSSAEPAGGEETVALSDLPLRSTPAEYFEWTKANQQRALKAMGHDTRRDARTRPSDAKPKPVSLGTDAAMPSAVASDATKSWVGVHTCHAECPCHAGGEPTPDFVDTPGPLERATLRSRDRAGLASPDTSGKPR